MEFTRFVRFRVPIMRTIAFCATLTLFSSLAIEVTAMAANESCRQYRNASGEPRFHPRSFADGHGEYEANSLAGRDNNPGLAVDAPDDESYVLGCLKWAVWKFTDNLIVDIDGPDLFLFETGTAQEQTDVSLSKDGVTWKPVGTIKGGEASINIHFYVEPGETFRYVRLTDRGTSCLNETAGADIDAIATYAYSWVDVFDESSTVFFDSGKAELKAEAMGAIDAHFSKVERERFSKIQIIGHTDTVNTEAFNQRLSEDRAKAVAGYLVQKDDIDPDDVEDSGRGESQLAVATNDDVHEPRNRRVEFVFIPTKPCQ